MPYQRGRRSWAWFGSLLAAAILGLSALASPAQAAVPSPPSGRVVEAAIISAAARLGADRSEVALLRWAAVIWENDCYGFAPGQAGDCPGSAQPGYVRWVGPAESGVRFSAGLPGRARFIGLGRGPMPVDEAMPEPLPDDAILATAGAANGDVPDWVWGVIAAICGSAVLLGLAYIVWLRRRPPS